ncbi:MAG TPA: ATP-binding protein, partial [Anaerolineaceae bacterium]
TPLVIADRHKMRQVFLNLFTNAADAMPDGGELTLRTGPGENGTSREIEIEDNGMGIPADALPHVMDPFFTTKPERKGTGLGLAISRRIIEEHQGSLQISSPGRNQGTTVRIVLPCAAGGKSGPVFDLEGR